MQIQRHQLGQSHPGGDRAVGCVIEPGTRPGLRRAHWTDVRFVRGWQVRRHVIDRLGGSVSWAVDRDDNGHDDARPARRSGGDG